MEAPGGVEPPTNGLGNRCSIHLSYGATAERAHFQFTCRDIPGAKLFAPRFHERCAIFAL